MAIDANAAKAGVHTAAGGNETKYRLRIARIRENALRIRRRKRRRKERIKRAVHVASKTQRMLYREPLILMRQIFIHVDEDGVAAGNSSLVEHICKNWEVIN